MRKLFVDRVRGGKSPLWASGVCGGAESSVDFPGDPGGPNVPLLVTLLFFVLAFWSGAKSPTKTPLNYSKTSEPKLSDHVLFMSIRQIFAYIFASENKVSETTFSGFSGVS